MNAPHDFNVRDNVKQKILNHLATVEQPDPDDYASRGSVMLAMLPHQRSAAYHEWVDTLQAIIQLQEAIQLTQQDLHAGNSVYVAETVRILAAKIQQELSSLSDFARHIAETEVFAADNKAYILRKDGTLADFPLNFVTDYTDPNEETYDLERD